MQVEKVNEKTDKVKLGEHALTPFCLNHKLLFKLAEKLLTRCDTFHIHVYDTTSEHFALDHEPQT